MMLLLLLSLLLPATAASSEEVEGSTDDSDDEDLVKSKGFNLVENDPDMDRTTGVAEASDQFTVIVVGVVVAVVALSVAVIVAILLVRRNMHSRQQGVYSVPTEQSQKGSV